MNQSGATTTEQTTDDYRDTYAGVTMGA